MQDEEDQAYKEGVLPYHLKYYLAAGMPRSRLPKRFQGARFFSKYKGEYEVEMKYIGTDDNLDNEEKLEKALEKALVKIKELKTN